MKRNLVMFIGVVILLFFTSCTLFKNNDSVIVNGDYNIKDRIYDSKINNGFGGVKGSVFSLENKDYLKMGYVSVDGYKQVLIDSTGSFGLLLKTGLHDITFSSVGNSDLKIDNFYIDEHIIVELDIHLGYNIIYCG